MRPLLLLTFLLFFFAQIGNACSCAPPIKANTPRDIAKWYGNNADVIFEGTAMNVELRLFKSNAKVEDLVPASGGTPHKEYRFNVSRVYKGKPAQEFTILTGFGGGDCGEVFDPDTSYVVYAHLSKDGQLSTGICSGNFELEGENATLRLLLGEPPAAEDTEDRDTLAQVESGSAKQTPDWAKVCGTVLPSKNTAVASIQVVLLRRDKFGLRISAHGETEADGSFCVNYVEPGKYALAAISGDDATDIEGVSYYPGVQSRSQAAEIEVQKGTQISKLIFPFTSARLPTISGKVIVKSDSGGLPENVGVVLFGDPQVSMFPIQSKQIDADGKFHFSALPGHYTLFLVGGDECEEESTCRWLTRISQVDLTEGDAQASLELIPRQLSRMKD